MPGSALLSGPAGRLIASAPPAGREESRDAARRELQKEMYHRDDPSLFTRLVGAVGREVGRLFTRAAELAPGGRVGLAVLLLLIVLVIVAIRWKLGPLARSSGVLDATGRYRSTTATDHRREADRCAAAGDWAAAVRERLRAIVRELETRGVLESRPGRTATEVAAAAGALVPGIAGDLRSAAQTFDEIWYGGRPAGREADALLRDVDERVRRARLTVAPTVQPLQGATLR